MIAGANRPPANGTATESNRVVPILFASAARIKRFSIVDRISLVLDLPVVVLVSAPFDHQCSTSSAFFQKLMQKEKRAKARANYDRFVAGIHSVGVNEWHC